MTTTTVHAFGSRLYGALRGTSLEVGAGTTAYAHYRHKQLEAALAGRVLDSARYACLAGVARRRGG